MLLTVSTIKDSPDNVHFFVEANLASGVDHMFVFLDAPRDAGQPEVADQLADHPHVTCIPAGRRAWWVDGRPQSLNTRQRINANWVRALLEPFGWAEWLFHIDGDEVATLDREALAAAPADLDAVWLPPLEAVSELRPEGRPTRFKRLLDDGDLTLLHVLGAVDAPTNQSYFHGHVMGKSGVRPGSGLALTLHGAISPDGQIQPRHSDDRLRLLHYDAISGEEFVRKWSALASAGPARYRASRAPTARALKNLASRDLPHEVREKYLRRIYESTTQDDVTLLTELDLLDVVDPTRGGHSPVQLPAGESDRLADRVRELRAQPKRPYFIAELDKDRRHTPARDGVTGVGARARRIARRLRSG